MIKMAATPNEARDKTVTGYPIRPGQVSATWVDAYPSHPGHVAAGYPVGSTYPDGVVPAPPSSTTRSFQPMGLIHDQNQHPRTGPNRPKLLRLLVISSIVILSLMTIFLFVAWLVLRPSLPIFRVDSASVSPLNITQSKLNATWVLTLLVSNPNHRLNINYDRLEAGIFYGGDIILATASLKPFLQRKRSETRVRILLGSVNADVGEAAVSEISKERARGPVRFEVILQASIRFWAGQLELREHLIQVDCDSVRIGFGANNGTGIFVGESNPCEVDL